MKLISILEIATWRFEMPHNRITEMLKSETLFGSACGHNQWSHLWKMEEGASATKLHFKDCDMEHKEIFTTGFPKCRNAKLQNKCKTLQIQSNGAGEFKYDQRATVALHSVTARNE
jgi:hypothetical protein